MPEYFGNTNLQINGTGIQFMTKEYLIDAYPSLVDNFKTAGLWVWGLNVNFTLGDNTNIRKSSPVQTAAGGTNWKQGAGLRNHGFALKTDGTLWGWGINNSGQLGTNNTTNRSSPVQTVSATTNWRQVSTGCLSDQTYGIKTDGTLWAWGFNVIYGSLGDNTTVPKSSPVQTAAGGTNWNFVSAGLYYAAALKTDGTLWTWGKNTYGQLGDNSTTSRSSPVQTVSAGTNWKKLSCGREVTHAIKTDGTLWVWGRNSYGQLGIGTSGSLGDTDNRSSPVQTIAGGSNWREVAVGGAHTAAIKTDGTLWSWGNNNFGQLGLNFGAIFRFSSPVQIQSGGTNWKQVACGEAHTAGIKTDGTLWMWGRNGYGQLGDGTITNRSSPVQTVSGGTNWKQVSCGQLYTIAIRDDSADPFRLDTL